MVLTNSVKPATWLHSDLLHGYPPMIHPDRERALLSITADRLLYPTIARGAPDPGESRRSSQRSSRLSHRSTPRSSRPPSAAQQPDPGDPPPEDELSILGIATSTRPAAREAGSTGGRRGGGRDRARSGRAAWDRSERLAAIRLSAREATDALQGKLRERTTQERCALQESYKTMRTLTSSAGPSSDGTTHVPGEKKAAAGTCLSLEGFRLALDKLGIPLSAQDSEEAFRALHADGGVLPIELAQFLINVINSGSGVVESTDASDTATEDSAPWASGEQAATASAKRAVASKLAAEAEQGGGGGGESSSLAASWTDDELDQNLIAALEQRLSIKKGHLKHQGGKARARLLCTCKRGAG